MNNDCVTRIARVKVFKNCIDSHRRKGLLKQFTGEREHMTKKDPFDVDKKIPIYQNAHSKKAFLMFEFKTGGIFKHVCARIKTGKVYKVHGYSFSCSCGISSSVLQRILVK